MAYGIKSPCYQCADRKPNCHSSCEKYDEYKKNERARKHYMYQQINPPGCRYFKERVKHGSAPQSKKRYR